MASTPAPLQKYRSLNDTIRQINGFVNTAIANLLDPTRQENVSRQLVDILTTHRMIFHVQPTRRSKLWELLRDRSYEDLFHVVTTAAIAWKIDQSLLDLDVDGSPTQSGIIEALIESATQIGTIDTDLGLKSRLAKPSEARETFTNNPWFCVLYLLWLANITGVVSGDYTND